MKHVKRITHPVYAIDWDDVWPWLIGIAVVIFGAEQFFDKETNTT